MHGWSRRDLLKTGMVAPAAAAAMPPLSEEQQANAVSANETEQGNAHRERLLLDSGWRFHLGHANDPTKDFSFGRSGTFSKTGNFKPPAARTSTMPSGKRWTCRTIGLSSCPSRTTPPSQSRGFYPMGRNYPETSIGWYRRVFELPAADAGKRHLHRIRWRLPRGYGDLQRLLHRPSTKAATTPFSFDVTDFAVPGGRNVLLVRVDATQSDGWFYEGAGIYRHVWLVKTQPVHVKQVGHARALPGARRRGRAFHPHGSGQPRQGPPERPRDFDHSRFRRQDGGPGPRPRRRPIAEWDGHTYEQQISVKTSGPVVARAAEPVQAGDRGGIGRRRRRSVRDHLRHPHARVRRGEGLPAERQVREGQGNLQPPGPRRPRCGPARRGSVLPRPDAAGDGLQRLPHAPTTIPRPNCSTLATAWGCW